MLLPWLQKQYHTYMLTTHNSDDHRNAQSVTGQELQQYFIGLGYEIIHTDQPWRHATLRLRKDSVEYFAKVASTPAIGVRTTNEIAWNTGTREYLTQHPSINLEIAPIIVHGMWGDLPYYITYFYPGRVLFEDANPTIQEQDIARAVQATLDLEQIPAFPLPNDPEPVDPTELAKQYLDKVQGWLNQADTFEVIPVLHHLKQKAGEILMQHYIPTLQHGCLDLGHLRIAGEKTLVIDGEAASSKACRFYDAAYLYHRLYTKSPFSNLAEMYRNALYQSLTPKDQELFAVLFPAILTLRAVGGFYDYFLKDGTVRETHEKLVQTVSDLGYHAY
jgi:hypothetical protein